MTSNSEATRVASPEWVTAVRGDRVTNEGIAGAWSVFAGPVARGSAFTDFSDHAMTVPAGSSAVARGVRYHELLHARFSPSFVPSSLSEQLGIPVSTLKIAEETRVNLLGRTAHYDSEDRRRGRGEPFVGHDSYAVLSESIAALRDGTETKSADFCAENDDWRGAVYLMFSTWGTDVFRDVKRRLRRREEWKQPVQFVARRLQACFPYSAGHSYWRADTWSSTSPVLYKWRGRHVVQETLIPRGFAVATISIALLIEELIENSPTNDRGQDNHSGRDGEPDKGRTPDTRTVSRARWVAPRFGITSLTENTARFIGRRKRPAAMGRRPVRPDRLITDPERRIFREDVTGHGGVVVFDCSGSMGVDHEVVRNAVAQFAGATVLAYTAGDYGRANLWVLARNGRMISKDDMTELPLNRGNGLDGPALRHAIRLRKNPRDFVMWVSDFGVTGLHDNQDRDHLIDCADICRRHNIVQVENCEQAIAKLTEMKRFGMNPRRSWTNSTLKHYVREIERGTIPVPVVPVQEQ